MTAACWRTTATACRPTASARLSADGGRTWERELVLRDDGGSHDLGYPRVVQLADGRVLAAYSSNCADDSIQYEGGVRHIAATIFTP